VSESFFSKRFLFSKVFEKREHSRIYSNRIFLLFFEFGYYKFALTYEPEYFSGHIQFFAMSKGFEKFTDSGYLSIFGDLEKMASRSKLQKYILMRLIEVGIDLENPRPAQLSLF